MFIYFSDQSNMGTGWTQYESHTFDNTASFLHASDHNYSYQSKFKACCPKHSKIITYCSGYDNFPIINSLANCDLRQSVVYYVINTAVQRRI